MPGLVDPRFPARMRELREQRGLSLRRLARAVPCSHVHIWDLEEGRKTPSPEMASRLDEVLGGGGELVALFYGTADEVTGTWAPGAGSFGTDDADALAAMLVSQAPTPGNALRLAHEWLVAEPPQVYEVRAGRRIGAATVERLERRVHQLRLLDDHIGGADSYTVATAELAATAKLLREASYTELVGRRLLVAVGELAQLAGWVASDAGWYAQAERLYLAGAWAAQTGGDTAGAANNLSSLAYQIANVGDPRDAVLLARTAYCRAEPVATATSRALLLERVAWGHARTGGAEACTRALGQVEEAYSHRQPDDDPLWVYWLDEDEIEVMAGRCWTVLERPLRAVPILRRATAGYGEDQSRETALYVSWLAEALVQAHEVEEAAVAATRALTLSRKVRSSRASERVDAVHGLLHPHSATATVRTFEDLYHQDAPVS